VLAGEDRLRVARPVGERAETEASIEQPAVPVQIQVRILTTCQAGAAGPGSPWRRAASSREGLPNHGRYRAAMPFSTVTPNDLEWITRPHAENEHAEILDPAV